jgi:hypothetical protein
MAARYAPDRLASSHVNVPASRFVRIPCARVGENIFAVPRHPTAGFRRRRRFIAVPEQLATDRPLCPTCRRGGLRLMRQIRNPRTGRSARYFRCESCAHIKIEDDDSAAPPPNAR